MSNYLCGQALEKSTSLTRSDLPKSVSHVRSNTWAENGHSLYAANGERKYLNRDERRRALQSMAKLTPHYRLYAQLLAWTGARPSEILSVNAGSFDIEAGTVNIVTLKRRKHAVRGVPIPPDLMTAVVRHFNLRQVQADGFQAGRRLFAFSRVTAWRIIKKVMAWAGIGGIKASPKGFRHGFGVCALQSRVPLTLVQRWLGHSRLSTTAIYLNVSGPDELVFARWFWNGGRHTQPGVSAITSAMAA